MINYQDGYMYAAFFMEGLRDAGDYEALLDKWGKGCVELVSTLMGYVDFTLACSDAADKIVGDDGWPGVFEYEVCSEFGEWFGKHVLEHGHGPDRQEAQDWLKERTLSFFLLGDHGPIKAQAITNAIRGVQ